MSKTPDTATHDDHPTDWRQRYKVPILVVGPLLIPKAVQLLNWYKQTSNAERTIHELPSRVRKALNLLFFSALVCFLLTLPPFIPRNIFEQTSSNLHTANSLLFSRLSSAHHLSSLETALQQKLISLESRLQYAAYGPSTVAFCTFCHPEDPSRSFYYLLPVIVGAHLLHLAVLSFATSSFVSAQESKLWRTRAIMVGIVLAVADVWLHSSYDHRINAHLSQTGQVDWFYWRARTFRLMMILFCDAGLAWLMYASSTNRAFVDHKRGDQRLIATGTHLMRTGMSLDILKMVSNAQRQSEMLRAESQSFSVAQSKKAEAVMNHDQVNTQRKRNAEWMDEQKMRNEARSRAEDILSCLDPRRTTPLAINDHLKTA